MVHAVTVMEAAKVHRTGFTCLSASGSHEPQSSKDTFNIIFIHGLRGHPRHTWEGPRPKMRTERLPFKLPMPRRPLPVPSTPSIANNESVPCGTKCVEMGVFSPQEFLVHDIPEAKVWTYGYNADVIAGFFQASNQNKVHQHGEDLAAKICRDIDNEGPIIFVAHSLGGIIVKDAFVRSELCRERTELIVFLRTPHRGSSYASKGQFLAKIAQLAGQDPNRDLLAVLEENSNALDTIQIEFENTLHSLSIKIHSFQEGRGMSGLRGFRNKIVDDVSSKIGLVGIETVETIDADHRQMARCSTRSDPQYRAVLGVLRHFILQRKACGDMESFLAGSHSLKETPRDHPLDPSCKLLLSQCHMSSGPNNATFLVPFSRNEAVIGRRAIFEILQSFHIESSSQNRLALFGLGGVGKTQLALEYVYRLKQSRQDISIFWIHASNAERFRDAFMSIAEANQIPGYDDCKANVFLLVKQWLENRDSNWLLVIDNADDMELFQGRATSATTVISDSDRINLSEYLPNCAQGAILITTRDKRIGAMLTGGQQLVEVTKLGHEESDQLLRDKLRGVDLLEVSALQELAARLEHLPLAFVHAASFIRENTISVTGYLALLEKGDRHMTRLLSEEFSSKQSPFAERLLSFMSSLDRQSIPLEILRSFSLRYYVNHEAEVDIELTKALGVLRSLSFITMGGGKDHSMHRLVQLVTQKWLATKNLRERFAGEALIAVEAVYPRDSNNPRTWGKCNAYLAHAYSVLRIADSTIRNSETARASLLYKVAKFLEITGDWLQSKSLYLQALRALRSANQERTTLMSTCVTRLAYVYAELGHGTLASVYREQKRFAESVDLTLKALEGMRVEYGDEHPNTTGYKLNLAYIYRDQGRWIESEPLWMQIVETSQRVVGDVHPDTARYSVELGRVYLELNKLGKAEELLIHALGRVERIFGEKHECTVAAMRHLRKWYKLNGEDEKAELFHKRSWILTKKVFGEEDGRALSATWDFIKLLENRGRVLGTEHRYTLDALHFYGVLTFKSGMLMEAEAGFQKEFGLRKRVHGEENKLTLRSLQWLADTQFRGGQFRDSRLSYELAVRIRRNVFGEDEEGTLNLVYGCALCLEAMGEQNAARAEMVDCNNQQRRILGPSHPSAIRTLTVVERLSLQR
ncbi:hypothetical protein QBC37DRAFT_444461 [Rhypophila decipiens]|uniref:ORC1/DEAH AAA+ ATPase domain-containing protein n=1 Tax=Rhypophila decipiens TaxID=261697 RepID=A0AAN6XV49_9PEZI|nr:hypothetical protein QBC37DRAFT_444461 [Rhypophila decipiens]